MYRDQRISLVIPAHNEEKLIKPTLENVPDVVDKVFVISDGSTDSTVHRYSFVSGVQGVSKTKLP